MVDWKSTTSGHAVTIAKAVVRSRYTAAAFAFAAGSIFRGEGTYGSDIDLVVVYDRVAAARRESFVTDDVPVEAFVHDLETLKWFMHADVTRGRPSILNMIVEGVIIGRDKVRAELLRGEVSELLTNGPPPLSAIALNILRYEITDALDDLRGDRTFAERLAIGAALYPGLVEMALRGRGCWNGTGKWAPRLLNALDAGLAASFDAAFLALFTSGDTGPVIALAEDELLPHGGRLFDGDRRDAPADWRVP